MMKKVKYVVLCICCLYSGLSFAQKNDSISVEAIVQQHGEKSVLKKSYVDLEAMRNDPELQSMGFDFDALNFNLHKKTDFVSPHIMVFNHNMDSVQNRVEKIALSIDVKSMKAMSDSLYENMKVFRIDSDSMRVSMAKMQPHIDSLRAHAFKTRMAFKDSAKIFEKHIMLINHSKTMKLLTDSIGAYFSPESMKGFEDSVEASVNFKILVIKSDQKLFTIDDEDDFENEANFSPQLYPNRGNGEFSLSTEQEAEGNVTVNVRDSNGKVHFEKTYKVMPGEHKEDIDLQAISKGVYIVEIIQNGKKVQKRMKIE